MIAIFHIDDYRAVYYTIIMAVYFTDIIYINISFTMSMCIICEAEINTMLQR